MTVLAGEIADPAVVRAGILAAENLILIDAVETNVAATQTTSGTTELDLPRLASSFNLDLVSDRLYLTAIQVVTTRTTATEEFEFRLRLTTAVSGTLLGSALAWGESGTAGRYVRAHILWTPGSTLTTQVHLSVVRNSGAGTMTVFYDNFGQLAMTQVAHFLVGPLSRYRLITT